ncbi:MAG: hypothetical protein IBX41_04840 [Methanophagales archaeon]|nr:hypothetical protein [Methanophagales archaeon]
MPLILENFLIRKKHDSLPAGSSGFYVRVPSVFLFMLSDGAAIRGELKQSNEEQELTLILEKGTGEDILHISAEDWNDTFTDGRAYLQLNEAFQNGKRIPLYEKRDVVTSPAQACKISSKR